MSPISTARQRWPRSTAKLQALAATLGVEVEAFQSNHEGALIDKLHESIDRVQGALINPAGLTQYGVPLHDAIKAMPFPVLEVHLSNLAAREEWRHRSIISPGGESHDPGPWLALLHNGASPRSSKCSAKRHA